MRSYRERSPAVIRDIRGVDAVRVRIAVVYSRGIVGSLVRCRCQEGVPDFQFFGVSSDVIINMLILLRWLWVT
jgi:hypothetical protein